MFGGASNFSASVDKTFIFIIGISLFFLVGITTTMIVFAIKYNRKRHPKAVQIKDNTWLEITWTVIPIILVLMMFYYGFYAFIPERHPPKDAIPIKVIGQMWKWSFDYGEGKISADTLVVPVNKAVRLNMTSLDVNHSLYISAFRIKEDLVPGMTTTMWFIAEREGQFDILCAEFCGLRHSYMRGIVKVVSEDEYKNWLANFNSSTASSEPKGLTILKQNACLGCHTIDGTKLVGPTFKDLFASECLVITDGKERKIKVDEDYIKSSILNPNQDIVKGFNGGMMMTYKGIVKDDDIKDIVEYFKQISDKKD